MPRSERQERDVERLIGRLKDGDLDGRKLAAYGLGLGRSVEAGPALVACLDDPDEGMRMTVLRALGRIGDKRAIPAVMRAAHHDPSLAVSTRAIDVLAQLGDPRAIDGFVSLLTETDRHLGGGRHETAFGRKTLSYSQVKWRLEKWAGRRLVELRARDAASTVSAAVAGAGSFRERLLLRRTAFRLRHPPRVGPWLKPYLWWWATLLGVFVIAAWISRSGSTAGTTTHYFAYAVIGLVLLVVGVRWLRR
ncbi:MAG TPA: HEAT repeat domain-containing protein [Gaiellaceae bacterium]|jgi:HEAT repeat protein